VHIVLGGKLEFGMRLKLATLPGGGGVTLKVIGVLDGHSSLKVVAVVVTASPNSI
jgi:hypothetical protein